ncbi:hypothetical protein K491DRAFT_606355 [Lophiostoma macrostomum CBS 122681]|uniref:Zn(2)-C6 fungal-type domain-containing protein n=1 Tax=Lophiostoma macrostomum CBS 122681 TaxID=1314788 RepID=A0A6A6SXK3_9PLEO|nr:hypothetical protein K491DRAFT_606355 [Lophiostoma macrostomum CBS 122681]
MASKQAACLNCRKSKIRCKRNSGAAICEKCEAGGSECIIPSFHIGRQKGVKNKRTGLDKAIYQIEEAIKRSKSDAVASEGTLEQLQHLLDEARGTVSETADTASSSTSLPFPPERDGAGLSSDDQLAVDGAENPLQLLARASDLRIISPSIIDPRITTPAATAVVSDREATSDNFQFFQPLRAKLDVGPDLDPIDIGLLSLEDAEMLLSFFHDKLAHTRWGLDPLVHTLPFVRNRSAFLFTALLTAAARFMASAAALQKRLLLHRRWLAQQIVFRKYRSVEIVLAFMVNVPWMSPGTHAGDDATSMHISLATGIALDLSLNKIVIPSWSFDQDILKRVPKSDCIEGKKALAIDGFEDVEQRSEWGQRLLRRRERVWIALFVLERGVCLARGRDYCVPITPLVKYCDRWHTEGISDPHDGSLVSMAVLRRDLDVLFNTVRSRCDSYRVIDVGSKVAQEIEATIDDFFNRWLATWTKAIGEGDHKTLPPYVEILVTHTRLSTYSGVINHPTAPLEVKRQFRASALSSALNVMRAAIQGEARLQSMPNNTVIMICFAACIALNLSTPSRGESNNLAPSVRNLIEETAIVLGRIGSTPSHRNGSGIIYGQYLRDLVKQAPVLETRPQPDLDNSVTASSASQNAVPISAIEPVVTYPQPQYPIATSWGEPLQFSSMSGNEVIETVMNAGGFDTSLFDISLDDANAFGWMDWMNPPDFGFQ